MCADLYWLWHHEAVESYGEVHGPKDLQPSNGDSRSYQPVWMKADEGSTEKE